MQTSVNQSSAVPGALKAGGIKIATQAVQSVAQVYTAQRTTEIDVLTGSGQYTQRQAVINAATSAGINLASSAISGAALSTVLGVATGGVGALVGAAVTIATTAISKATEYSTAQKNINANYQAEAQELDYLRSRAGPYYNGSR
jgi:hypothetical protein